MVMELLVDSGAYLTAAPLLCFQGWLDWAWAGGTVSVFKCVKSLNLRDLPRGCPHHAKRMISLQLHKVQHLKLTRLFPT